MILAEERICRLKYGGRTKGQRGQALKREKC
jgi:hypothetical protein